MLTIKKIKIYNKYGGDIDNLVRIGKSTEKTLFNDNEWSLVDEFEQDIKLISDRLVSRGFREQVLKNLIEKLDSEAKDYFTLKIPFFCDFKEVSEIISVIKSKVTSETNTTWSGFENVEVLLKELDSYQNQIELLDFETLDKIMIEFLPTGTFQELAITNGWHDDYLRIAEQLDTLYNRIKKNA